MSEDKSFDSFYGKLNEMVIGKSNLGEKTEDSKIVRNPSIIAGELPYKSYSN